MSKAQHTSRDIKEALKQGYIWVKNGIGEVFKSRVNGIIVEGAEICFIQTCEDRTQNPPHLQCYNYKQYVYSSCWALTKEELKPYKEEISFGENY